MEWFLSVSFARCPFPSRLFIHIGVTLKSVCRTGLYGVTRAAFGSTIVATDTQGDGLNLYSASLRDRRTLSRRVSFKQKTQQISPISELEALRAQSVSF